MDMITFVKSAFFSNNIPTCADVNYIINYYKTTLLITTGLSISINILKELTDILLKIPIFCNEIISLFDIILSTYIVHCGCIETKTDFNKYYMQWIYSRVLLYKLRKNITLNDNDKLIFYNVELLIPALLHSPDENIIFLIEMQNLFILLWNMDIETLINDRSIFEKTIIKFVATFEKWKTNVLLEPYETLPLWYLQPGFGLTYHTSNNATLFGLLGNFYKKLLLLRYSSVDCDIQITKPKNTSLKIGFLSRALYNHSIGRISCGLIEKLYEYPDIETYVYSSLDDSTALSRDTFSKRIFNASTKYKTISTINCIDTVNSIRNDCLDALIIIDPCTDIFTYCVSIYKCAPLQLTTWGHPETSGIENIDYYITSKIFEKQADNIYYEKPYYMNSMSFYYYNLKNTHNFDPIEMFKDISQKELRKSIQIPDFACENNNHIYGILSSMFKFHPSFDIIINGILYNDKNAYIVFIQGVHDELYKNIIRRLSQTIHKDYIHRIIILPYQTEPYSYEKLILSCDVILDTFPFGGCISTLDAFCCNKCVVTLPGNKLYGRFTQGFYNIMGGGFDELISKDENDYIKNALKVATYPPFRRSLENKIANNKYKLYENKESIDEWYNFLKVNCN